jgi:phage tail sheath protein FI
MGESSGVDNETVTVYPTRNLTAATPGWVGQTTEFVETDPATYKIRESNASVADAFASSIPVPLRKGSEGSLRTATGAVDTAEAETLLEQAYTGLIDDDMLDPELIYFSLVFDAGYPDDVKSAISTLVQTRKDCVAIIDNSDNSTVNLALSRRTNINTFNNFYVTMYECFNKVSDPFTGSDIWFSPIYHMSYLIPRNDNVAEIWFAAAGFNRAAIDTIKDLRFNPRLGQRDQLYLKQLNPIVKFAQGYVVWGQLTSQAKPSALQDLNIVRLVLFCKRALEQYCRFFIFEQNDQVTWGQVASNITDFLEVIKNRRGLDDYQVEVGATDYERKTKTFHVNVTLTPTRVVERIELNFFIK